MTDPHHQRLLAWRGNRPGANPTGASTRRTNRGIAAWAQLGAVLVLCALTTVDAHATFYKKFFIADQVAAGTDIFAGALTETWAGDKKAKDIVTLLNEPGVAKVQRVYEHAAPKPPTDSKSINGATRARVIRDTGVNVAHGAATATLYGPKSARAEDGSKGHNRPNDATARISVFSEPAININKRGPLGGVVQAAFANAVNSVIEGSADAGKPTPPDTAAGKRDKFHSANSWAGTYLKGARFFVKDVATPTPFDVAQRADLALSGTLSRSGKFARKRVLDPMFFTILDIDTGLQVAEEIMRLDIESLGADVNIDDSGIHLAIALDVPGAFASIAFATTSNWVVDPYAYSVSLTAGGLAVTGAALPLAGWTVTSSAGGIEAGFDFGPGGQPFDFAEILPPDALFTDGHSYRYSIGSAGGALELASAPEPSTLALLGLAGLGWRRRRAGGGNTPAG